MSVAQFTIRSRGQSFPVTIVSAQTDFYQGSEAQWDLTAPDPGPLLAGDVVLVHIAAQNGRSDSPVPSGWAQLYFETTGVNSERLTVLRGRRISANGTLSSFDRTWPFFVNQTGSSARISIVVLRGVPGTGIVSIISTRSGSVADVPAGGEAALTSQVRPSAVSLSLHFVHTNPGDVSAAPLGWTSVLEAEVTSGSGGTYYIEAAQYAEGGTTEALARTTSPTRRATALISITAG